MISSRESLILIVHVCVYDCVRSNRGRHIHPHTKLSKYRTRIIWSWWQLAWRQFQYVLGSAFLHIRVCPGLSFATKRIGPPWCILFTFVTCFSLQIILTQNYLLPIISVLAENTLLKTAYHFLPLVVGFDTLTYQKDYDRSPILVGHQDFFLAPLPGSEVPLVGGIW